MQITSSQDREYSKVVAVVGVTASGKSQLGMQLAEEYDGEIICADSRTIYRGMDIGTAKPTLADQSQVPHHLLDMVEPGDRFTAADFKLHALEVISDISRRGKLPLLIGGTGLYVDSVIFDYAFSTVNELGFKREDLVGYSIKELLAALDEHHIPIPENEKNRRYLIRTLERGGGGHTDRQQLRPSTLVLGVSCENSVLRKRVEVRVEQMFRKGLRREVDGLVGRYGWRNEALTGIGYREFRTNYEGRASMSEVKREIVQDTLKLAKHQRTWFKRDPYIEWVDSYEEASSKVNDFLQAE
ncbi:MAG TPA: tRNA (adenosine(37)-N6)-dimethylallyltransferase MiaA [Candidatus Saccharimonadales bacterium]|nr:tRNA (adenosine(37)-N6)-dimethylallyltransferase MiaA [Candidatus Saccharimonadales bacterium]